MAKGIPTDPFLSSQWHLGTGTWSINVQDVWEDYTGQGVLVAAYDDGFEYTHPDLSPNFRTDLDFDFGQNDTDSAPLNGDNHGTATLGIIGADDNGSGVVGVAFDSDITGFRTEFGTSSVVYPTALQRAETSGIDILNNSWSYNGAFADNFKTTTFANMGAELEDVVELGRNTLGTIVVFSAGNNRNPAFSFVSGWSDNANYHNLQNSPYTIAVAAIDEDGTTATDSNGVDFSSPGSNILISAPGTNVITSDRVGGNGYTSTSEVSFGGTSASAPIISGVAALMLEANSNLGYRDVQDILALTARKNDPGSASWQDNGAGLHFSHDFGFGLVDAKAAVRLAETWTLQQTFLNIDDHTQTIVENASFGAGTFTFNMTVTQDIIIEHVIINVDFTTAYGNDIDILLTSPDGTVSHLANNPLIYGTMDIDFDFSSVAHWGESSAGTWTLTIIDPILAGGNAASFLSDWSLTFIGDQQSPDDLYVFTQKRVPTLIDDQDGGDDTVNFAALEDDITVDLSQQTNPQSIGSSSFTFTSGTNVENLITGDGNDTITGSSSDNTIRGGRGNDRLIYDVGDNNGNTDNFDGDKGDDTLQFDFIGAEFVQAAWTELNDFLTFLSGNSDSSSINGPEFTFGYFGLTVSDFEFLEVFVDGVLQSEIPGGDPNTDPVAVNDNTTTDEDVAVTINVLSNDTDADLDTLTVSSATDGANGTTTVNADNTVTYTPNAGFFGSDSFTYTISDGNGGTSSATVNITVNEVTPPPPPPTDNVITGTEGNDTDLPGTAANDDIFGLGGNDRLLGSLGADDFDGGDGYDTVSYFLSTEGVNINLETGIHSGADAVGDTYTNIEGILGSNKAGDTFRGDAANNFFNGYGGDDIFYVSAGVDTLFGWNGADTFIFEAAYAFDGIDNIRLFSEAGGDIIDLSNILGLYNESINIITDFVQITDDGTHSYLSVDVDGGADNFQQLAVLQLTTGLSDVGTLEANGTLITTSSTPSTNTDPVAVNDNTVTDEDVAVTVDVLTNDTDADLDTLTLSSATDGTNGTTTVNADNTITYTPNAGFFGTDSFSYTISDGNGGFSSATVNVTVNEVVTPPPPPGNTITGTEGNDIDLAGTAGDDDIFGLGGNDRLLGSLGADDFDGGDGDFDAVSYFFSSEAVNINLETGIHSGSDAVGDTYTNIEQILGSNGGNDTFRGDAANNFFNGYGGDDTFYASAGIDTLFGWNGADTFIFEAASAFDGVDNLRFFSEVQGDVIDISDVLVGYDSLTDAISDFVEITTDGTHTYIAVDADGGADNFQQLAVLGNVTGVSDVDTLEANGTLKTEII